MRTPEEAAQAQLEAYNARDLEAFLAGVVGAEMPAYWEPQALQAQAIAARTYCLYIKRRFGARRSWDLLSSQAHQLYRGVNAESQPVWDAVEKTSGLVLVCQTQDGNEDLFPTYYSSTCGGHTENSRNVFGDSFEPLTGLPCPYCKYVAKPIFYFWPRVEFDTEEVSRRLIDRYPSLSKLGQITDITISRQSDYQKFSRATSVKLVGTSGKSDYLRAEDFRLTIDPSGARIRSTSFRLKKQTGKWAFVSGRGFGHAVGMCQCGAQYMARTGKDAHEILSFYYPNSKIVSVYESEQF